MLKQNLRPAQTQPAHEVRRRSTTSVDESAPPTVGYLSTLSPRLPSAVSFLLDTEAVLALGEGGLLCGL